MAEDINIGAISEALNNKVDLNQLNTNAQGLSYGSGWGMPSNRYIDLQLGASGATYTAPANGYFSLIKAGASGQHIAMINDSLGGTLGLGTVASLTSSTSAREWCLCKKGDKVSVFYTVNGETRSFRFYYAEGEI